MTDKPEILPPSLPPNEPPTQADFPDWKDLLSDGVRAGLKSAVGPLGDVAVFGFDLATGEYHRKQVQKQQWLWLLQLAARMSKKIEELHQAQPGQGPTPADIGAVLAAVIAASHKTADRKKRELLEIAAVNSFDSDLYDGGMTLRLIAMMEDLVYGDILALRACMELHELSDASRRGQPDFVVKTFTKLGGTRNLLDHHLEKLWEHGLVVSGVRQIEPLGCLLLLLLREDRLDSDS